MEKIIIKAYTEFNFGDDLFIKILCDRYSKINFIVSTNKNYTQLKGLKFQNLKIINFEIFYLRVINYIFRKLKISENIISEITYKTSKAVINIGGSIFMQHYKSNNCKLTHRENELKMNKNYFVMGANFGPYTDEKFYKSHYDIFQKYIDVCFRDKESYNLFKDLKNVRLASDIVFSLDTNRNCKNEEKSSEYILYSIIKPSIRSYLRNKDEEYYIKMKECIIEGIEKGENIKLMSFCQAEGDEDAIDRIYQILPKEYSKFITRYDYKGDINEALEVIQKSKYIVAARFHAMILGFIYNKPVYPIVYSKKMTNVLDDIDFEGTRGDFLELDKIKKENIYSNKLLNKKTLEFLKEDSKNHFKKLDDFLDKH
ncbi:MAG: polysaccharide pyruvyl transferase family protein [Cetobacterium sp.]